MTINVVVDIEVVSGKLTLFLEAMQELINETLREEGCIRFEVYLCESEGDKILLIEEWRDQDAIDSHMELEYTKDFIQRVDGLMVSTPRVRRLNPIPLNVGLNSKVAEVRK